MILRGKGLIVPDVHERIVKLLRILALYEPLVDWVLFLGDFFDSFNYGGRASEDTKQICRWLIENHNNPKYRFLYGNHDVHYAFPWGDLKCSGWTPDKHRLINGMLEKKHWSNFRLISWILPDDESDGNVVGPRKWLCSHAGLHPSLLHPLHGYDTEALLDMEQIVLADLNFGQVGAWLQAGRGRGGSASIGGVDWLDWNREFTPIDGLNQIVGHTQGQIPRVKETSDSFNICIDSNMNHILLVENGKIDLQEVPDAALT